MRSENRSMIQDQKEQDRSGNKGQSSKPAGDSRSPPFARHGNDEEKERDQRQL